jgi:S1-C subfamily serine protease
VVQDALKIYIRVLNGNSYKASILGQDPYSDIAVLQIDPPSNFYNEHIVPLSLGNLSKLTVSFL